MPVYALLQLRMKYAVWSTGSSKSDMSSDGMPSRETRVVVVSGAGPFRLADIQGWAEKRMAVVHAGAAQHAPTHHRLTQHSRQ